MIFWKDSQWNRSWLQMSKIYSVIISVNLVCIWLMSTNQPGLWLNERNKTLTTSLCVQYSHTDATDELGSVFDYHLINAFNARSITFPILMKYVNWFKQVYQKLVLSFWGSTSAIISLQTHSNMNLIFLVWELRCLHFIVEPCLCHWSADFEIRKSR